MVISGLLLMSKPGHQEQVTERLAAIPEVEVHQVVEDYKIVITIEADSMERSEQIAFKDIAAMPGVLGVYLAYCHFEGIMEDQMQQMDNLQFLEIR